MPDVTRIPVTTLPRERARRGAVGTGGGSPDRDHGAAAAAAAVLTAPGREERA